MNTNLSRGAAAALVALTFAAPAVAQVAAGSISPRTRGDSVVIRTFGAGKFDTISVLFRELGQQQYGSEAWVEISRKLDSLVMSAPGRVTIRSSAVGVGGPSEIMPRGWVGFNAQGPSQTFVDNDGYRVTYFAYPSILSVDPESPADRAGIVPGDVLVAFNGTDVVGHEFNLTRLFVPEKKVGVTIRRSGENKDYSLDVVKAPEGVFNRRLAFTRVPMAAMRPMPPLPPEGVMRIDIDRSDLERSEAAARRAASAAAASGAGISAVPRRPTTNVRMGGLLMSGNFAIITPHGVFGADVSPVGPELARALKLEKGVLVNDVPEQSPAFKAGLRAGDVIVSASGQPVVTLDQLQNQVVNRLGERSVTLQVMRNRKPSNVTVTW